jgi:hypothetical protein
MTGSKISTDQLCEIATILAGGLLRLQGRKSSPNLLIPAESSLDCEGFVSGDVGHPREDAAA